MKNFLTVMALVIASALVAVACGNSGAGEGAADEGAADGERVETLWVGPQLEDCVGAFPQTCLLVRYRETGQVEYFYDSIQGFEHVAGTSYVLRVGASDVADPPADASSVSYRLIEILESSSEPATADLDGTSWKLIGFKDGDLFDPAIEDIDVTLTFDGDTAFGSAGCNSYSASYTADDNELTVDELLSTLIGCLGDEMNQERRFMGILETVETAEITFDERLILKPATGLTLVFVSAS